MSLDMWLVLAGQLFFIPCPNIKICLNKHYEALEKIVESLEHP
jgi:hypothetical protein